MDDNFQEMVSTSRTVGEITAFIANSLADAGFRVEVDAVTYGKTPTISVGKIDIKVVEDEIIAGGSKFPIHDPDCFDKLIAHVKKSKSPRK